MIKKCILSLVTSVSTVLACGSVSAGSATVLIGVTTSATPSQIQAAQNNFGTSATTPQQIIATQTAVALQASNPGITAQQALSNANAAAITAFGFGATPTQILAAQTAQAVFGVLQPTRSQIEGILTLNNALGTTVGLLGTPTTQITAEQAQALFNGVGITINPNATTNVGPAPAPGSPQAIAFQTTLNTLYPNPANSAAVTSALANLSNLF